MKRLFINTDDDCGRLARHACDGLDLHRLSPAIAAMHELSMLPCVPKPGKIICLGVNYIDHWIKCGDTIEIEIEGVGTLINKVTT